MTASDIAIIIAAAANAGAVLIGLGRLQGKIEDVRQDMRSLSQDTRSCLQTLLLLIKPANPGESNPKGVQ